MIIGAENVKRPSVLMEKMTKVLKFKVIPMDKNWWMTLIITIVSAFVCVCVREREQERREGRQRMCLYVCELMEGGVYIFFSVPVPKSSVYPSLNAAVTACKKKTIIKINDIYLILPVVGGGIYCFHLPTVISGLLNPDQHLLLLHSCGRSIREIPPG